MSVAMQVAVIGAGLTGLRAARALQDAGLTPVVFDKGRGIGGRLATRRTRDGLRFDHGAQYLLAQDPGFADALAAAKSADAAVDWRLHSGEIGCVGRPGMSGLAGFLGRGLDIRQGVAVPALETSSGGWRVAGEDFDRVIVTVPAPQARRLIGTPHPLADALQHVVMDPNLTLMLALPTSGTGFRTRDVADDDVAWLALDSSKQGRAGPACWVAQAGLDWSKTHLERDKAEIAAALLPLVCDRLAAAPTEALYVAAHRWRYAQTSTPLGQPYLTSDNMLFVGGDWALSRHAEGAWQSGTAMARAVLATR